MEPQAPAADRPQRTQRMNFTIYHLLVTLVNLLNLPRKGGTYIPRRSSRLTVYERHLRHLKLLKEELDKGDERSVRAYLIPLKSLVFEVGFLLEQEPGLQRNPEFFEGFERLERLIYDASDVEDFGELAHLAYRLAIVLPFYEDEEALAERRRQAERYAATQGRERP